MVKRRIFTAAVALSTMFCPATIDAESLPSCDFSYVARQNGSFGSNGGDQLIDNQVDLRSFAGEIKRNNIMTKTPDALIAAIDRAVVYNDTRGRYKRKGGGISAYHLYESGDLNVYLKQTSAPEPQKKLYDQLSKQHRDVLSRLSREESQQVQSDPTFSNNPKADKSDSADKTDKTDLNKMRGKEDRPSEGFSDLMADVLTAEEKAPFIAEYQNILRDFRRKGLLPADKDFNDLTDEETMRVAEAASPEDIARMQNLVYRVNAVYNRKLVSMIEHDYDFDGTLTATVPQDMMDYITSVQCIVCQAVEDGLPDIGIDGSAPAFLGIGTDVQVNWQESKFTGKFPTAWPTLNGIPIYIEVVSENADYDDAGNVTGGYNTYIVPIKLNGEDCSLEVAYDFTDNRYYVFGISGGITLTFSASKICRERESRPRHSQLRFKTASLRTWTSPSPTRHRRVILGISYG